MNEVPKNIVPLRNKGEFFSRKQDEPLSEYKRRLTRYIKTLQRSVADLQKNVVDWTEEYRTWSDEAKRLEGLRETGAANWPLPQREAALAGARERATQDLQRRDWYQAELKKVEANLERYLQFRTSLDLQSKYAKRGEQG